MKTIKRMPSDAIRLHFWTIDKHCYVVTDSISEAKKAMQKEYDNVDIAANQDMEISDIDIELYFLN